MKKILLALVVASALSTPTLAQVSDLSDYHWALADSSLPPPNFSLDDVSKEMVEITVQFKGGQFPSSGIFDSRHQGQRRSMYLITKERAFDGGMKEIPNGWSYVLDEINADKVKLSITFTEQEVSETFLFEVVPSDDVQCQSFPFNKEIVQSPRVCLSKARGS
ncbi:hypothetical protein AB4391_01505 [Vibrio lentus]|uniref:Uncharacterized protein n=1 Tax=Vibrio lentus TaxID=136468 RepID=A0A2N7KP07_9VIBR|nr:hypothetical protein [Vibrio lentus]PMM78444.1 hypothetical protein BCT49_00075 [Vibrio lentus]